MLFLFIKILIILIIFPILNLIFLIIRNWVVIIIKLFRFVVLRRSIGIKNLMVLRMSFIIDKLIFQLFIILRLLNYLCWLNWFSLFFYLVNTAFTFLCILIDFIQKLMSFFIQLKLHFLYFLNLNFFLFINIKFSFGAAVNMFNNILLEWWAHLIIYKPWIINYFVWFEFFNDLVLDISEIIDIFLKLLSLF